MSKTNVFSITDEEVICKACSFGPCIIARLAVIPDSMPDNFEFEKTDSALRIPLECPLD